jgi:hypothetical protein
MAVQKPPVSFYAEEAAKVSDDKKTTTTTKDFQEFKRTDPNDATIVTKVKVAQIDSSATTEDMLCSIHQFHKAATKLAWTTGPKKFDNFELLLAGALQDQWERITARITNKSNDTFKDAILSMVKTKVPKDDAFEIQQ